MTAVVITGLGLVSALGSRDRTWSRLLQGESAIAIAQPFPELAPRPLALIGDKPADLQSLTRQLVLETLNDGGITAPLPDLGVVIGSSRSTQGHWEAIARRFFVSHDSLPDSSDCLHYLPDLPARIAAGVTGTQEIIKAPMSACNTAMWALIHGYELVRTQQCQQVLAGAVETPITPLALAGFTQMGALAKTGCYPFDRDREGLVLGEGGAFFLLESLERARSRYAKIYGQLAGWGATADAYHVSAPKPDRGTAAIAIKEALERAELTPDAIDYIHAHGTSTRLNDGTESELIQYLFSHPVAVSSTKGATGHTLGASGAFGVAFSLMTMRDGILPPCVGLTHPEFDLNFVDEAKEKMCDRSLCLSFGFGGGNTAIVLTREVWG
ncbi:beta-ketoacyl-ACP synthase [Roseofilum casamattae]|uniref:Beta-ketoacyl-ACP synthase n=1 Tax=Roseofilum casamattae BLCC-M143 TaxID=3022442 RepID=A0ABT7C373_9CYAN|nr:beta-ketoacyl-ACP synthase [Roseofilum casamattae]MDJ1185121.1 beta-ketoacyl-ACP synthase [Roseofilum casamattae BLCC-M143]